MGTTLKGLSNQLFQFLRQMDEEGDTTAGCNSHAGLIDYAAYKGLAGKKYEESWNDRLAELLLNKETSVQREFYYPNSKKRCDLVITNNNITIWLEVKAAWKCWFSSTSGKLETSPSYKSYLFGDKHKTHSVADDIDKLNSLSSDVADYIALLVIGFDAPDKSITPDMEQLIEKNNLREDRWQIFGPEIWPDRNHANCRYNCWVLSKKVVW